MPVGDDADTRVRWLQERAIAGYEAAFDTERMLVRQETETGTYHPTRESLKYARGLLLRDTETDRVRALGVIAAVLAVQERRADDPHRGNWPWMADDGYVADLNAVEFCLEELVSIRLESTDRLPPDTITAIDTAMRFGLAEVARIDVDIAYTNITLLDVHNSVLGGQVLGDGAIVARGARKLAAWARYTAAGSPREFNSPTYGGVDLTALAALAEHAENPSTRLLARLWEERLWLSAALHFHAATAQLAGPHSRAYHNDVMGGRGPLKTVLWRELGADALMRVTPFYALRQGDGNLDVAQTTYHLPAEIRGMFAAKPLPLPVIEHASEFDLITTVTDHWALGTACQGYSGQSDNLMLHYAKEAAPGFGVLYSRFILNKKRLGSTLHATDRTYANNLTDEGQFRGFQAGNVAIGVYGLPYTGEISAAALDLFVPGRAGIKAIIVGTDTVTTLPALVPPHTPVVIADGEVLIGLSPLRHTRMGSNAPVRLEERDGDLVLSQVLYDGPPKRFWEYSGLSGPFYKGNVESGVIVQVADRAAFPSATAFAAFLMTAHLTDATVDGIRTIHYRCGGNDLRFRYRLDDLAIVERWVNRESFIPTPLTSPLALAGHGDAPLSLNGVTLTAPDAGAWLYRDPTDGAIVATRATTAPGRFTLDLPTGERLHAEHTGLIRVALPSGKERIAIDYAGPTTMLECEGWPVQPALVVNGGDVAPLAGGNGIWRVTLP